MRGRIVGFFILVFALSVGGSFGASTCIMPYLELSTLPRVAALGEASVAVTDATWAEANPAHLSLIEGGLITFSHTTWFEDISLETLSVGTSKGKHGFGISVVGLHTDPLEGYDIEGKYTGTFRYFDFLVSASYGRVLYSSLRAGVNGKVLYEKIDWDSATGFAVDLGLGYVYPTTVRGGKLSAGLTLKNLGSKIGYFEKDYNLPLSFQGGICYRSDFGSDRLSGLVALDFRKTRSYDSGLLFGLELSVMDMWMLRMGYRGIHEDADITFGMGINYSRFQIDYAYLDFGEKLGNTHRIGLSIKTGPIFPSPEENP